MKLPNAEKGVLKKEYRFDEAYNIFDEIDNKCSELNEYNPRVSNKIDTKNVMLEYLKIVEDRLNDMFSFPSIIRTINNTNQKESAHDELKYKRGSEDPRQADAILDPFKFTEKEKVKTEEPQETISETVK